MVDFPEESHHWGLQPVAWGQVLVLRTQARCQPSDEYMFTLSFYVLRESHSHPRLPRRPCKPAGWSGPDSYEVTAFALGLGVHESLYAPSKCGVSVSPSPVEFLQSSPPALQSQMLWGIFLLMPDPQAEEPDVGLRTLIPVGQLLKYNYSTVCGSPLGRCGDLIISQVHPSYCLIVISFLSLDVEYLFLVGSSLFH